MRLKDRARLPPRVWLAVSLALIVAGGAWFGCFIYDPSLLLPAPGDASVDGTNGGDGANPAEAGVDAGGPDGDSGSAFVCPHPRWPDPPDADDPSDAGPDVQYVLAMRMLNVGIGVEGGVPDPQGYDLDYVCTCPGPDSCSSEAGPHCDDDAGRDTAFPTLAREYVQGVGIDLFDEKTIDTWIGGGNYTVLLHLTNYNGTANDTNVLVDLYLSAGMPLDDAGALEAPRWDGTDPWTVDPSWLISPPFLPTTNRDVAAYVTNSVLVATLDFPVSSSGYGDKSGSVQFVVPEAKVTGTLQPLNGGLALTNGQVVGRLSTRALLFALNTITPTNQMPFICPGTQSYVGAKSLICANADITADPAKDNTGSPCGAFSFGAGMTMVPAQLGYVVDAGPDVYNCDAPAEDCP